MRDIPLTYATAALAVSDCVLHLLQPGNPARHLTEDCCGGEEGGVA